MYVSSLGSCKTYLLGFKHFNNLINDFFNRVCKTTNKTQSLYVVHTIKMIDFVQNEHEKDLIASAG